GSVERKVPENVAVRYWDDFITPFASYGFNKSHACCYAYNSYITAYLKANYPDEFICACLNTEVRRKSSDWERKVDLLTKNLNEIFIKILPKSINTCGADYKILKKKDVSLGITHTEILPSLICEGIGYESAQHIEKKQPFKGIKDFATRTKTKLVNARVVAALASNGFFGNKAKKDVVSFVDKFANWRHDIKAAGRRGVIAGNMFEPENSE
ncbi:unnamed protein product, partial [marine sediment metagenome]